MNPLTNVKNITKLNEIELAKGLTSKSSWHNLYKDSAWIFIGGLAYGITEGDVITVFSQYGEIVNINMVRDKKTGKTKGFCFLCYTNQKSTVLAVDNLNGIKICGRTIRVDHVENYRLPKEHENDDDITKALQAEGCAPKPLQADDDDDTNDVQIIKVKQKKVKKEKKEKKKKKKKKHKHSKRDDEEPRSDKRKERLEGADSILKKRKDDAAENFAQKTKQHQTHSLDAVMESTSKKHYLKDKSEKRTRYSESSDNESSESSVNSDSKTQRGREDEMKRSKYHSHRTKSLVDTAESNDLESSTNSDSNFKKSKDKDDYDRRRRKHDRHRSRSPNNIKHYSEHRSQYESGREKLVTERGSSHRSKDKNSDHKKYFDRTNTEYVKSKYSAKHHRH